METKDLNLAGLMENVREIKNAIKQNSYTFQQFFDFPLLKLTLIFAGLIFFFVPIFYYLLLKSYPGYGAIPFEIRTALILAVILAFSLFGYTKISFYLEVRRQQPKSSWLNFFSRLISRQALLIYPILLGAICFFIVYFLSGRMYHLLVPTLAIGMGICFSTVGAFISATEFFIFGNYFWIAGMLSVPFIAKAPQAALLWAAGIFGLGMLFFGMYLLFFFRPSKEH
ncbi:MAG: hypothetical protein K6U80_14120 [Firmicutes bacterium]|nr:hypothetical protein [Bacillota bacterium]